MPRKWSQAFENAANGWTQTVSEKGMTDPPIASAIADDLSRVIRAAVRATHPGRQQGPNMAKLMAAAERAATRALHAATKRILG